ncbi:MAG: DUF1684 domain-containing protein [Candidatus Woykebacteria bacterium]
MSDLSDFRKEKDELFGTKDESPLNQEQKAQFKGLNYYPEDSNYQVSGNLSKNPSEEIINIKTSVGDIQPYKRYGKVSFSVQGREVALNIYQSTDSGHLFVPFRDTTNGTDTYHDGRFVEAEEENGKLDIDFNYAYNPYCAYNENFRCPISPEENTLDVEIKAGEKRYH